MKRLFVIGGGALGLIVLIVVVILFYVVSSLDPLIKAAVEKYGSEFTQVEVTLKEADVSVTSGKGALRGLSIGNPQGFKSERAFSLGEISLALDIGTVTQDTIVIKEVVISAPEVTYEIGPQGNNISAIQRNVDASLGKGKGKPETNEQKGAAKDESAGPKLVIEHLYIRNGKVKVSSTLVQGQKLSALLPEIHLTGIGKKSGGATPGEVIKQVIGAMGQSTTKAVGTLDLGKGAVKKATEGVGSALKNLFSK